MNIRLGYYALIIMAALLFCPPGPGAAEQAPKKEQVETSLAALKEELLGYFAPLSATPSSITGDMVQLSADAGSSLKPGMRLVAYREGVGFVHPVTKEHLGNVEIPVGKLEVVSVQGSSASARVIDGKIDSLQGIKVKLPAAKQKLLFYQGTVDWHLGDAYYQMVKDSGRFELIDTGLETDNPALVLAEAKKKGADSVLILSTQTSGDLVAVTQKIYWTNSAQTFSTKEATVHVTAVRDLRLRSGMIGAGAEVLVAYRLPFSSDKIAAGDLRGDGRHQIILVGSKVAVYQPDTDLKLLWEFDLPAHHELLSLDTADLGKTGRDKIVLTLLRKRGTDNATSDVSSSARTVGKTEIIALIYELQGETFKQVYRGNHFIRPLTPELLMGQEYDSSSGYSGPVFAMEFRNGEYRKGAPLGIPKGLNIFDFQILTSADGTKGYVAWDENGFLQLFNEKGVRIWMSRQDYGGPLLKFKVEAPSIMESDTWTVKGRIMARFAEVLAVKRKPLFNWVKGIGHTESELRSFWWNGVSLEERVFVQDIGGEMLDYYLAGDRIYAIAKPLFGIQWKNILKGTNPFGSLLYVFSTKGR